MRLTETIDSPDWPFTSDDLMSNFDGIIDEKVAAELKEQEVLAAYPGWNFHAQCWFDRQTGKYMAAVRRYHSLIATFAADTPAELRDVISGEFGHD